MCVFKKQTAQILKCPFLSLVHRFALVLYKLHKLAFSPGATCWDCRVYLLSDLYMVYDGKRALLQ